MGNRYLMKKYFDNEVEVEAVFSKRGSKYDVEMNRKLYRTVMISNVKINNEVVSDHCWIRLNDNIFKGVIKGSLITIKATVKRYKKMIGNEWKTDYCLQDVHTLNVIKKAKH